MLQGDRDGDREGVHHSRKGRALLAEPQEDLPEPVVGIRTGGEIAFRATDPERRRDRRPGLREPLAYRRRGRCHDSHVRGLSGGSCLAVGQRLADLAVVTVDGKRLQAELPTVVVDLLDLLDGGALRQVHRLGDGARQERLDGGHHRHVPGRGDRAPAGPSHPSASMMLSWCRSDGRSRRIVGAVVLSSSGPGCRVSWNGSDRGAGMVASWCRSDTGDAAQGA